MMLLILMGEGWMVASQWIFLAFVLITTGFVWLATRLNPSKRPSTVR